MPAASEARGPLIAGYAAYTSPVPPAGATRARGIAMAGAAGAAMAAGSADAEEQARAALEVLVDAFLLNRRGNRDCFDRAHALGRTINRRFGCAWSFDAERNVYENTCGVLALHNRLGLSPGGPTVGACSICGASDFQCDHVPGRRYEGRFCQRVIVEFNLEEISLVTVPRDPRCYRVHFPKPREEVERLRGRPLRRGEQPLCSHCEGCAGIEGASEEDLDPSRWDSLPQG